MMRVDTDLRVTGIGLNSRDSRRHHEADELAHLLNSANDEQHGGAHGKNASDTEPHASMLESIEDRVELSAGIAARAHESDDGRLKPEFVIASEVVDHAFAELVKCKILEAPAEALLAQSRFDQHSALSLLA